METPFHQLKDLFAQLGLDNKPEDIRAFIRAHTPLSSEIRLEDAPFWTPSQADFLRQALDADGDWAETVDLLNAELRVHE